MSCRLAVVVNGVLTQPADVSTSSQAAVPWWSFTKTVIAAAALALVRDGRLALDAPVATKPYSLRHLLQHTSGLPDYGGIADYHAAVARGDAPWTVPRLLEAAGADRLLFEPGHGWSYSNIGYLTVCQMIAAATGERLEEALRRLVLDPLGVTRVRLAAESRDLDTVEMGAAQGYHPCWVYHGLLVGPLDEAARLLDGLLGGALLPQSLADDMARAVGLDVDVGHRPWLAPAYGLGLMMAKTRGGLRVAGHTGGGPGSAIAVYRTRHLERCITAAAFSPGDNAIVVETAVVSALASIARADD